MASPVEARPGRPPRVDDAGVATRERLLAAAAGSCVEHGFEGATVADIAARAGVSAPAIYNHFGGKVELLVAAGKDALGRLGRRGGAARPDTADAVRTFLAPEFAASRRLLTELHLAAGRHPQVAALLADWHTEQARLWRPASGRDRDAVVKTFFALLLGLCQIEALSALPAPAAAVRRRAEALAAVLYPEEEPA